MTFRRVFLLVAVFTLGMGEARPQTPRNIVLMIGDGMGVAHLTAGRTLKGSLQLEAFPNAGLLLTQPAGDEYITDSAAGATALSTGVKTNNGAIGVGPDGKPLESVLERAQHKGKKTGIVVVCSVTHATPAAFVAHVPSRNMQFEIADQIAASAVDLVLGGGWGWFLPKGEGGRRTDGQNLMHVMKGRGFFVVTTDSALQRLTPDGGQKILGLFAENHPGPAQDRRPSLASMTGFALAALASSPSGFVLMVEGSQIDWAAHDNKSDQVGAEVVDFDDAIGTVVEFARKNPETLIIVTADHETGGYALLDGSVKERRVKGAFATEGHTGSMVPVLAMGPGAERFMGIHENTVVGSTILELLGP